MAKIETVQTPSKEVPNYRGVKVGSVIVFTEESAPDLPHSYLTYDKPYVITEISHDMAGFIGDDGEVSAYGCGSNIRFIVIHNGYVPVKHEHKKSVVITLENQNEIDAFTCLVGSTKDAFSEKFNLPDGVISTIFAGLDVESSYYYHNNYPTMVGLLDLI